MKRSLYFIILLTCLFIPRQILAQTELAIDSPFVADYNYILPDFIIEAQQDSNYEKKLRRLVYNVKKVLPYAKMASFRFQMMEQNLQVLPTEKARKEYLKRTEKAVKDQFMDDLRNLTRSQGRILIKLIYRETGKTTYDLLQTYRGNFTAIYWQGLAKVFDANLKEEFNPVEDWQIEQIIKELGFE
jgi:CRP-like cAMP-binding protein